MVTDAVAARNVEVVHRAQRDIIDVLGITPSSALRHDVVEPGDPVG